MDLRDIVIEENQHFIAVNKPQGLVVNSSETSKHTTLQDLAKDYLKDLLVNYSVSELPESVYSIENEFIQRSGILHRLDKDTTGVILIAKTPLAFSTIKNLFLKRKITKAYYAVVWGNVQKLMAGHEYIKVDMPIARNPNSRHKFAIVTNGRPAVTKIYLENAYNVNSLLANQSLSEFKNKEFSFIKVVPRTGRTHQIRVHLKALNCEILGDAIYNGKNQIIFAKENDFTLMLHAYSLEFNAFDSSYTIKAPLSDNFSAGLNKLFS